MPLHVPCSLPCLVGVTFLFFFYWDLVFHLTLHCKMCLSTPFGCAQVLKHAEADAACTSGRCALSCAGRIFGACIKSRLWLVKVRKVRRNIYHFRPWLACAKSICGQFISYHIFFNEAACLASQTQSIPAIKEYKLKQSWIEFTKSSVS